MNEVLPNCPLQEIEISGRKIETNYLINWGYLPFADRKWANMMKLNEI